VHHHFFVGIAPMAVGEATLNAAIAFAEINPIQKTGIGPIS
jgi:hypothetical protein